MQDYNKIGLDKRLNKSGSLASKSRRWQDEYIQDVSMEKSPFAGPVLVSKGTVVITGGGVLQCKDVTGGTTIMTYDPSSGTVTITGDLTMQMISSGTITTSKFTAGTITTTQFSAGTVSTTTFSGGTVQTALLANGTLGTATITGGTVNPASYQINGTATYTGTVVFQDLGTVTHTVGINKGLITSWGTA